MEAMVNDDSAPTFLVEVPAEESQLIGLPTALRACLGTAVVEVWFEQPEGAAYCETYVAELLVRAADTLQWPMFLRTARPPEALRSEEVAVDGCALYRVPDMSMLRDAITTGWNTELAPFIVFVNTDGNVSFDHGEGIHGLCNSGFALACGADGHVVQLLPFSKGLEDLRALTRR